jgi:hypothetical protein
MNKFYNLFFQMFTGKIRGRVHCDSCNLRLKEANFLPVFLQVTHYLISYIVFSFAIIVHI